MSSPRKLLICFRVHGSCPISEWGQQHVCYVPEIVANNDVIYNVIEHRRDLAEAMPARDTPGRRCRQRAQAGAVITAIVGGFSSRLGRLPRQRGHLTILCAWRACGVVRAPDQVHRGSKPSTWQCGPS
jgi:hypothetical protein